MLVLIAALSTGAAQTPPQPAAPPPGTDIYLVPLGAGLSSLDDAKPQPVSTAPGYDNQPMFSPDGGQILLAAIATGSRSTSSSSTAAPDARHS